MARKRKQKKRVAPHIESLEPRLLYSADFLGGLGDTASNAVDMLDSDGSILLPLPGIDADKQDDLITPKPDIAEQPDRIESEERREAIEEALAEREASQFAALKLNEGLGADAIDQQEIQDFGVEFGQEINRNDERVTTDSATTAKFLDLQNLELSEFDTDNIESGELTRVAPGDAFFEELDQPGRTQEESIAKESVQPQMSASAAPLGVTTGILSWVLRTGSFFASMLTVLPMRRQFDPLPILTGDDEDEDTAKDEKKEETDSNDRVEDLIDQKTGRMYRQPESPSGL